MKLVNTITKICLLQIIRPTLDLHKKTLCSNSLPGDGLCHISWTTFIASLVLTVNDCEWNSDVFASKGADFSSTPCYIICQLKSTISMYVQYFV